jgi:hypothetical protein
MTGPSEPAAVAPGVELRGRALPDFPDLLRGGNRPLMEPLTLVNFVLSLTALAASITSYRAVSRARFRQDS